MTRDIFETVNEICEAYPGAEVGFVLLVGVSGHYEQDLPKDY